jgi:hypothetical protein
MKVCRTIVRQTFLTRNMNQPHFRSVFGIVSLLLLAVGCAHQPPEQQVAAWRVAATQPAFKTQLTQAKDLFYRAVAGDADVLPEARQILDSLGGGDSPDMQVVVYTGAVSLLQAKHATLPWEKVGLAHAGLDMEDRAVAGAPDDLEVRFLRGVTNYELPEFIGRHATGVSDLAAVAEVAEQAAREQRLDSRAAAAALDYHAKSLEADYKVEEAQVEWEAAVRVNAASPGGIDAAKHLAEHDSEASTQ